MKCLNEINRMESWAKAIQRHLDRMVRRPRKECVITAISFDEERPSELDDDLDGTGGLHDPPGQPDVPDDASLAAAGDQVGAADTFLLPLLWSPDDSDGSAAAVPNRLQDGAEESVPRRMTFVFTETVLHLSLDSDMLTPRETRRLLSGLPGVFWLKDHRWPYQSLAEWKAEVRSSNPLQKEYRHDDTATAAADAAWIYCGLWARPICPVCLPLYYRSWRCRAGRWRPTGAGIVWRVGRGKSENGRAEP